jgi:deoxyribose-phosphate aldolase
MTPPLAPPDLARFIDHTLLKADATAKDIEQLCADAREFGFYSVCVNGCRVDQARALLEDSPIKVVTVVGFPLGATDADAKRFETEAAIDAGAQEIDIVLNIAVDAGAQFVKTSTGFSTAGATIDDVKLLREVVGKKFGVKAAGGIRDAQTALAMIEAGADRLGTSASVAIVRALLSRPGSPSARV